jgi:glutaredoxin 3
MSARRKIEIFTAGCPLCAETVTAIKQAVASCGCEVIEHNISSQISREAQQYGVRAVPTIVIDGQIAFERKPTDQEIASLTLNP